MPLVVRYATIYEPLTKKKMLPIKLCVIMDYKTNLNPRDIIVLANVS